MMMFVRTVKPSVTDVCEDSEVISDKVGTRGDSDVCEDIEVQKRRNVNRIGGGGGAQRVCLI